MTGAVILAAGLSSRMGAFKPLLPLGESTFVDTIIERMRAAGVGRICVVTGWRGAELRGHLEGASDVHCVDNPQFVTAQMFDSVRLGLQALRDSAVDETPSRVLITPVDIPLVTVETLRRLIATRATAACPEDISTHRAGHPLSLDEEAVRAVLVAPRDASLKSALADAGIRTVHVLVRDPAVCRDTDTQEDYGALLRYRAQQASEPLRPRATAELTLWIGDVAVDARFMRLLALVDMCGSLRSAARAMRISYATARRRCAQVEDALGFTVIERAAGGSAGGASRLTRQGRDLLARWEDVDRDVRGALEGCFSRRFKGYSVEV